MTAQIPNEFTVTLSQKTIETTLATLYGAAEISSSSDAHRMLIAADSIRDQLRALGIIIDFTITETNRKRGWLR